MRKRPAAPSEEQIIENPDKRTIGIHFRMTAKEYESMTTQMKSLDYLSISKFVRECIKKGPARRGYRPKVKFEQAGLEEEHRRYLAIFRNIGSNWNKLVCDYHNACLNTRKDGSPVVSTNYTQAIFNRLSSQVDEMIALQKEIKSGVEKLTNEEK